MKVYFCFRTSREYVAFKIVKLFPPKIPFRIDLNYFSMFTLQKEFLKKNDQNPKETFRELSSTVINTGHAKYQRDGTKNFAKLSEI